MTDRPDLPPDVQFEEDPRYAVANREALWGLGYWLVFTVVISAVAWALGGNRSASDLSFVLGFPAWFFWSCLVAATVLAVVPIVVIRRFFTDLPLTADGAPDERLQDEVTR
jgi:uncharacterized membrane protein YhdT